MKRPGGSLTGLARMVGLILRLDRARLAVWVGVTAAVIIVTVCACCSIAVRIRSELS